MLVMQSTKRDGRGKRLHFFVVLIAEFRLCSGSQNQFVVTIEREP